MRSERESAIRESLEHDRLPILPVELVIAEESLRIHIQKQKALSKSFSEAMSQSSETWHDNAPAESVVSDSKVIAATAEKAAMILALADVISDDIEDNNDKVSLGSSVSLKLSSGKIIELILTGATPKISNMRCMTLTSPLGYAVFGKQVGDVVNYTVGSNKVSVTIVAVKNRTRTL